MAKRKVVVKCDVPALKLKAGTTATVEVTPEVETMLRPGVLEPLDGEAEAEAPDDGKGKGKDPK